MAEAPTPEDRRYSVRNDPVFILAILYTIGFFGFVFVICFHEIPTDNQKTVDQLIPILSAIQLGIVQYFYTRSAQATRDKADELNLRLANTAQTTATTAAVAAGIPPTVLPTSTVPNGNGKHTNGNHSAP